MLSHLPVNHHLRPFYRFLAALTGAYVLAFGLVGVFRTGDGDLFGRGSVSVLGLRTNLAFSIVSVVAAVVVLAAVLVGRNLVATVTFWAGVVFMLAGTAMMAVLNTGLNVLNYSMSTVVVSFVIGSVLFTAGMYTKWAAAAPAEV